MNLENILKVGMKNNREFIVSYEDTAEYIGNPGVKMLSTPAMMAYMELTSGDIVFPNIPKNYNPVGTMVCIKHLASTPINEKVVVYSTLIEIDRRRLTFQVEAYYGEILIGSGSYEQFVVELERFMKKQ